jgi:hypothetical protein
MSDLARMLGDVYGEPEGGDDEEPLVHWVQDRPASGRSLFADLATGPPVDGNGSAAEGADGPTEVPLADDGSLDGITITVRWHRGDDDIVPSRSTRRRRR